MRCVLILWIVGVWGLQEVSECNPERCLVENNCKCASLEGPIDKKDIPQLVMITFDDPAFVWILENLWKPLFFDRKNPDDCHIGITFFITHEYTDYDVVNQLYNQGFEIGVRGVTIHHPISFWKNASKENIVQELGRQRQIASKYANIPLDEIVGARIPFLVINEDTFLGLKQSGFQYDNSWSTQNMKPFFPHTLDYRSNISCLGICQKKSISDLWELPLVNWVDMNNSECREMKDCFTTESIGEIYLWMIMEFNKVYKGNRAPFSIPLNLALFVRNRFGAFQKFLDYLSDFNDVYVVNGRVVMEWMKNPVSKDQFKSCERVKPEAKCESVSCNWKKNGEIAHMRSCVECPKKYPWLEV